MINVFGGHREADLYLPINYSIYHSAISLRADTCQLQCSALTGSDNKNDHPSRSREVIALEFEKRSSSGKSEGTTTLSLSINTECVC